MNKGTRRIVTGVALLAAVAIGLKGCAARRQVTGSVSGTADTEYVVAARDVSAGTSVSGTIRPVRSATLTVQAQGEVTAVYVAEGDAVKDGDVLLRIDARSQQNQVAQAESRYRAAVASRTVTELSGVAQTKVQKAQLQSAQEQENQAALALSAQKLLLDNYVVKAPWDGTVLAVSVGVGDMATPQTSLVKIAQTSAWNVEAYVDEVDILNIKEGQEAQVAIDPYPDKEFAGTVSYLGKTLVRTPEGLNAYALKIRLTTAPATLVDGMSGDATVILSTAKSVLAIPVESLLNESGKEYVMLVAKNARGKAVTTKTEVSTGLEGDEYVQVTSGLKAGDTILRQPVVTQTSTSSGSPFMGG